MKGTIVSYTDGYAVIDVGFGSITAVTDIQDGSVDVFIRPENILLSKSMVMSSARNVLRANVVEMHSWGPLVDVKLDNELHVIVTRQSVEALNLAIGVMVFAIFKATSVHVSRSLR